MKRLGVISVGQFLTLTAPPHVTPYTRYRGRACRVLDILKQGTSYRARIVLPGRPGLKRRHGERLRPSSELILSTYEDLHGQSWAACKRQACPVRPGCTAFAKDFLKRLVN